MKISISLYGAFRECDPRGSVELDVPEPAKVSDLRAAFEAHGLAHWPAFKPGLLAASVFASESTLLRENEALPANGRLAVLPPVSGG